MFIYWRLKRDPQLQCVSNNVTLSHRYYSCLEWLVVSEGTHCQFNFNAYMIHISKVYTHMKFTGHSPTISYLKHVGGTFLYYRHRTQFYSLSRNTTLRPRQNGSKLPDDKFKGIFLNENIWISINISLKFVLKGPLTNVLALVLNMAWRRPGNKPFSESVMFRLLTHLCVTMLQLVNNCIM